MPSFYQPFILLLMKYRAKYLKNMPKKYQLFNKFGVFMGSFSDLHELCEWFKSYS